MQRKQNRLDKQRYKNYNIYYLTLCCFNKSKFFSDDHIINNCLSELRALASIYNAKLWAYCFMPDHLHLLLEAKDCSEIVKLFKQKTSFYFKKQNGTILWQKSYYDHILRGEEDLNGTMAYIFNNPVRAQLVGNYLDYSYSGSFEINKADFVET